MAKEEKNKSIGDMIAQLRKKKKISYNEIAEQASISVQLVEDIEKGMVSPSIGILKKITKILDIPLSQLFQQAGLSDGETEKLESGKEVVYIPKDQRRSLSVKGSRANIQSLTPIKSDHNLELLWQEVDAKSSGGDYMSHEGEECCFVVKGRIRLYIEEQVYELNEGDSVWFKTEQKHKWDNPHDEPAVILWAITPPFHGTV